ncbi:MAG TPA: hypothetical protein GX534_02465 [Thermoanaerobacterales bacterium]|nr:hypothetical protein [Thermoanaerobacterales bacterium]
MLLEEHKEGACDGKLQLLRKIVAILELGPNVAGAARRTRTGLHSAGCRIASFPLRSAGPSFRIAGRALSLAYRHKHLPTL